MPDEVLSLRQLHHLRFYGGYGGQHSHGVVFTDEERQELIDLGYVERYTVQATRITPAGLAKIGPPCAP